MIKHPAVNNRKTDVITVISKKYNLREKRRRDIKIAITNNKILKAPPRSCAEFIIVIKNA